MRRQALPKKLYGCQLINGDFREVSSLVPAGSVDLILTDPPYSRRDLPLWSALALEGARVLRPGGFLVALSGHYFLPEVFQAFAGHLAYYWTVCVRLTGPQGRRADKYLVNAWRPAVIWAKPPVLRPPAFFIDAIDTGGKDLAHHPWGQRPECFDYFVTHFSRPGDLVYDPMTGGGTVLASCQRLGRRAIGVEKDAAAHARARRRLSQITKNVAKS